mgnify:CR=1 FL=1
MPCSICSADGHNRRTCPHLPVLESLFQNSELEPNPEPEHEPPVIDLSGNTTTYLHSPPSHYTNIRFDVSYSEINIPSTLHSIYTPSTRNRTPVESITISPSSSITIPPIPFPDLENIDFGSIFGDDSDHDSLPDLEPIAVEPVKQNIATLIDCVEEPCVATDCAICMEDLKKTDLFVSRCGHQFHSTCMVVHMRRHDNCPMCRGVLFNGFV